MTSSAIVSNLITAVKNTIHTQGRDFIPLHEPVFAGNEKKYVVDCIDTGWVSSVGGYVDRFENDLAQSLGVKRVIAVVNGTAALHLALLGVGVERHDEVLMPALTFVATANAAAYLGAIPHFCDSAVDTMGLCPRKLREYLQEIAHINDKGDCINSKTGRRIKAIVPMHCFGHPVDMDALLDVARSYHIEVVEDAAESLGSTYHGRQAGSLARVAAISFNGNKIITTGGGGAIATQDEELGARLKHLSTTAKTSKDGFFMHDQVGYNYRMPNINAALGCAQLEVLPDFLMRKRRLAEAYMHIFEGSQGITFMREPQGGTSNYWLCAVRFLDESLLPEALATTHKAGLMTRPIWNLMPDLPMYAQSPSMDIAGARQLAASIMTLPSSANLVD